MRSPARSCASRRKVCACWKWRSASICRSASPAWSRMSARELRAPRVPVGRREQHARVEQLVEQQRVPRQVIGRPARRAHQLREARQHGRVLDQQGEIGAAPADRLEQVEQTLEDRLGSRRVGTLGARRRAGAAARASSTRCCDSAGSCDVAAARAQPGELGDEALGVVESRTRKGVPRRRAAQVTTPQRREAREIGRRGVLAGGGFAAPSP